MLPTDPTQRKHTPIMRGVLDYFPDALCAIAVVSQAGNDQHNPGEPLHWAREKSADHADCLVRHLLERGTLDIDGLQHTAKAAWRALALLQTEIESEVPPPLYGGGAKKYEGQLDKLLAYWAQRERDV